MVVLFSIECSTMYKHLRENMDLDSNYLKDFDVCLGQ